MFSREDRRPVEHVNRTLSRLNVLLSAPNRCEKSVGSRNYFYRACKC